VVLLPSDSTGGALVIEHHDEKVSYREGGEHLPMIGLIGAVLARAIQDFVKSGARHDYLISLSAVARTA
jgi:hypothetical protein